MPFSKPTYIPTQRPGISEEAAVRINRISDIMGYLQEFTKNAGQRRIIEYLKADIEFITEDMVRHGYMRLENKMPDFIDNNSEETQL